METRKNEMRLQRTVRLTQLAGLTLALMIAGTGCKKKIAAAPPPTPAPPPAVVATAKPAPVISFSGDPLSIVRGDAVTLRWTVQNSDAVTIEPGVGAVAASGSRQVYPTTSSTFTLRASGPGGSESARVTVNVTAPVEQPRPAPPSNEATFTDTLQRLVSDAYFGYDSAEIREDARATLQRNSDGLKEIFGKFTNATVVVEGHCDERGSAEYNLGLGEKRANAAREFLVQLGVSGDKLRSVTYGKERPVCSEATEDCWQKNRRAHFAPGQ
jgi:peptidoglycan-associated lipoprotein